MKNIKFLLIAIFSLLTIANAQAQESQDAKPKKKMLVISNKGIVVKEQPANMPDSTIAIIKDDGPRKKKKDDPFDSHFVVDLGINMLQDNTDYSRSDVRSYLNVPEDRKNANLLSLRQGKSINVNLTYLESFRLVNAKAQKIYLSSGLGLQMYNFRFNNNVTFTRNPSTLILDSVSLAKDKLGFNFLNVPLQLTFKTRLFKGHGKDKDGTWLVYGGGITGGYALSIWTKQVSDREGKVKAHDDFSFNRFNSTVNAEVGIEGIVRLYASYQLTNLYNNGMDQRPFCVGLRFGGI